MTPEQRAEALTFSIPEVARAALEEKPGEADA